MKVHRKSTVIWTAVQAQAKSNVWHAVRRGWCTSLPPSPSLRIGQSFSCSPAGSCCGHCSCELLPALLPRLPVPAAGLPGELGMSRGLAALGTGAAACSAWSSKTP